MPSGEVWIWNAVPYAASHCRTTWVIEALAPRSTCSHCGSEKALDQRVPVLPSTAAEAGVPAFSVDDAVAGLPCESSVAAFARLAGLAASARAAANATTSPMIEIRRPANDQRTCIKSEPISHLYCEKPFRECLPRLDTRLIS